MYIFLPRVFHNLEYTPFNYEESVCVDMYVCMYVCNTTVI